MEFVFVFLRVNGVLCCFFFFFNDTATTEIYTLSLHDALPISARNWPRPSNGTTQKGPAASAPSRTSSSTNSPPPPASAAAPAAWAPSPNAPGSTSPGPSGPPSPGSAARHPTPPHTSTRPSAPARSAPTPSRGSRTLTRAARHSADDHPTDAAPLRHQRAHGCRRRRAPGRWGRLVGGHRRTLHADVRAAVAARAACTYDS